MYMDLGRLNYIQLGLVPDLSPLRLKRCKSPCIEEIPAELIQAGGKTSLSEIQKERYPTVMKNVCSTY
jgi:hypothetical protein